MDVTSIKLLVRKEHFKPFFVFFLNSLHLSSFKTKPVDFPSLIAICVSFLGNLYFFFTSRFQRLYGLGDPELESRNSKRYFSCPKRPDWFWGPPRLLLNGHQAFFSRGEKRPGREFLSLTSIYLRLGGAVFPLPLYAFLACTRMILPFLHIYVGVRDGQGWAMNAGCHTR
jgi:hypothetical protein